MYEIVLKNKASEKLLDLIKKDFWSYKNIDQSLSEIECKWLDVSNIKNIWKYKWKFIFRKRVWRWRIVLTKSWNIISIWIVDIEKDTKKDYKKWKKYISRML